MTTGELAAVRAVDDRAVTVKELLDGRVEVSGTGEACPYYGSGCAVYAVRPGVCRAYGCFRKGAEPFYPRIMLKRMTESAGVRRVALRMLDEAEQWTRERG